MQERPVDVNPGTRHAWSSGTLRRRRGIGVAEAGDQFWGGVLHRKGGATVEDCCEIVHDETSDLVKGLGDGPGSMSTQDGVLRRSDRVFERHRLFGEHIDGSAKPSLQDEIRQGIEVDEVSPGDDDQDTSRANPLHESATAAANSSGGMGSSPPQTTSPSSCNRARSAPEKISAMRRK
jgi:hypothetical protein